MKLISVAAVSGLLAQNALASVGCTTACNPVPELDGGVALLALGLTAALVAIVRERLRRR